MGSPQFADQDIASFCAVTGANDDTACHFLSAADGNVEVAVSLFLDNPSLPTGAAPTRPIVVEEHVRAPIQPQRQRLVDDFGQDDDPYESSSYPRNPPMAFMPPVEPFRNFQAEVASPFTGSGHAIGLDDRGKRLAELFRAPTEIMFVGSFDMARRKARQEERYLLVTVHDPAEFPCQQMVRDVWNESAVQEYARESLVFLFLTVGTAEAQRYQQYYPFDSFPHWALIDPRTGKRVKSGSRVLKAAEMLMELVDYVCDHPLAVSPLDSAVSSKRRDSPVSLECLVGDDDEKMNVDGKGKGKGKGQEAEASTIVLPEEPSADNPAALTVQIRLPSGSRHRRRFLHTDKIQMLFDFVRSLNDPSLSTTVAFDIQVHTQSLAAHKDELLDGHHLKNAALTVVPLGN